MNRPFTWCAAALTFAGCAGIETADGTQAEQPVAAEAAELHVAHSGAVFTQSNESSGNRVMAFERDDDGELSAADPVATGGTGSGDSLGSQSALVLSENHHFLFVVNAGSNDVSAFAVRGAHLTLIQPRRLRRHAPDQRHRAPRPGLCAQCRSPGECYRLLSRRSRQARADPRCDEPAQRGQRRPRAGRTHAGCSRAGRDGEGDQPDRHVPRHRVWPRGCADGASVAIRN